MIRVAGAGETPQFIGCPAGEFSLRFGVIKAVGKANTALKPVLLLCFQVN